MSLSVNSIKRVLVIKHGALGDIIKALGAFRVLRQYFPQAQITLLTTRPYQSICAATGYFDQIVCDTRSWNILTTFSILRSFSRDNYDFVIDLQSSKRTNRYFNIWRMLSDSPWCGTAPRCQYPIPMALKEQVHIYDRFYTQMKLLGMRVDQQSIAPSIEWLGPKESSVPNFDKSVILIPGSSPVALQKRWPVAFYAQVAIYLAEQGITPVIVGGDEESALAEFIQQQCPQACDMTKKTSLLDIGHLAKDAIAVIGNDTGPTYFASAAGKPTIVLWSSYSNPEVHAPRGKHVTILQQDCLDDLPVTRVKESLKDILHK
jgi:ADP-heptose:LPS heptosyltransferase